MKIDLLIVDDDADFRRTVVRRFLRRGYEVQEAASGEEALECHTQRQFDVIILDMVMPGLCGLDVLEKLKKAGTDSEVILLTGQGTIESAVQAMKLGAYDYLTKPFPLAELEVLIQKAAERNRLGRENRQLRELLKRHEPQWEMVGNSPQMRTIFRLITKAGPSDQAILIQGESGTGKELVARALHQASLRAEKPMVTVNCASVPESLLESELFGHEKGAFTGAAGTRMGLFEMADGGTLFIDEIGEMPAAMQAKLLRVLEDGTFRRVGSIQERRANIRLLCATNRNLADDVSSSRFREDLYYRVNVMTIDLPPLRERSEDIPLLISRYLGEDWHIDPEALKRLIRYRWPGNVRQLINVIERAKILADDRRLYRDDLPAEIAQTDTTRPAALASSFERGDGAAGAPHDNGFPDDLETLQRSKVREVLHREGGNKSRAARALGITRRSLYRLLDKYDLK